MLETVEVGATVSKADYEAEVKQLRVDLLNAQFDLQEASFPVIVLVVGNDRPGCNATVQTLHEWIDVRHVRTRAFGPPTVEEATYPRMWRYWMHLPANGRIGIYLGGLALEMISQRAAGKIDDAGLDLQANHMVQFLETLAEDGALVLRFWLHLPKKELGKRLKKSKKYKDWRLDEQDWRIHESYDDSVPIVERVLRKTALPRAPWNLVESTDERHRNLTVGKALLSALTNRLTATEPPPPPSNDAVELETGGNVLDTIDLSASLKRGEYRQRLDDLQTRLRKLARTACERDHRLVLVFEGQDAAGKGGAIRRITNAMNVRDYKVVPVAAPTDEERSHHYLWRFWRHLPREGKILVFDRSWYGRVLVERVEGFAHEAEWRRAYREINDFEEQLVEHGVGVVKFWLQIDRDEQLARFQARERTPYKKYKITDEDYRNRERWDEYAAAVNEMVARTSSEIAPWHLVAANDKRWARIRILETVVEAVERAQADPA